MEELESKLILALSNTTIPEFTLMINNKPIALRERTNGKDITRLGKVKLNKSSKKKSLLIGCRREVNNQTVLVNDDRVLEEIKAELYNYDIAGIDFSGVATTGYNVDFDVNLGIVYVTTPLHRKLLDILKMETDRGLQLSTKGGTTLNLTLADVRKIKEVYLEEMYIRYRDTYQDIIARKLSSPKLLKDANLRFFKTAKAFVPVLVEGNFIFNPLTQVPFIFKFFKETDFYKQCLEVGSVQVGSIAVYYLTHLEISQALHLERFMRFTAPFTIALLFASYIPGIADENTLVYKVKRDYVLDVKDKVIPGEVMHLYQDIEYMYTPVTTLYYACFMRTRRDDRATTLYNIVKQYSL